MVKDLETEKSILSGIFEHGKDGYVDVSDIITAETFDESIHQVIFSCLKCALEKTEKIDLPIFLASAHELGLDGLIKDNKELIEELRNRHIELENIRLLGKKIAKLALIRIGKTKLRQAQFDLDKLTGEETATSILELIERPGNEIQVLMNSTEESGQLIGKEAVEYVENLISNPNIEVGIPTGMPEFDKAIGGGIRRGGFALRGARRKIGKSSEAITIARYVADKLKIPVLILDTEMSANQHLPRFLASMTSIPVSVIEHATFTGNKMFVEQLRSAAKKLKTLGITHERVAGKDFKEIISIARRWVMKEVGFHESGKTNNCLIIYDYFKLMDPSSLKAMKEYEAMGYQATQLADFLGEYDVACLAYVQLNRECDIAQSDRLSWLATSVTLLMEKTPEEIVTEGYENGNRKTVYDVSRFGRGMDKDDHINIEFNGELCQFTELGTAKEAKLEREIGKAGFSVDDSDED